MNHFRCALDRISWCEIKRFKSSLSVPNPEIRIPHRIKRGPTDILRALESTVPKDVAAKHYVFRKDPYLFPLKAVQQRSYGLSYESGRKAAIWIHNEHKDLFPEHLSEPQINAFIPPVTYTDKNEVSEEMLLHAIAYRKINDALQIYNLLEDNVSNETKQVLLELLCFYRSEDTLQDKLHFQYLYQSNDTGYTLYMQKYTKEIDKLYESLIKVDSPIAEAAYNTMICGLIKGLQIEKAWLLYKKCREKNVSFNVTTYNYILSVHKNMFEGDGYLRLQSLFETLERMNKNRVKPNVITLNTVLRVIVTLNGKDINDITVLLECLLRQFKSIGVKFSLATYFHILCLYQAQDDSMKIYAKFQDILAEVVKCKTFTIEDELDSEFFQCAMIVASDFSDAKSAHQIHDLLLAQERYFLNRVAETNYYNHYMLCMLSTCSVQEFFNFYNSVIPCTYMPSKKVFSGILEKCMHATAEELATYLPKLWSNIYVTCHKDISLVLSFIDLFKTNISLGPTLKATFMNIAQDCWDIIKMKVYSEELEQFSIKSDKLASIALIFLHGDNVEESIKVLECAVKESHVVIGTMTAHQLNKLFEYYISKQCIIGAFLVLEYSINLGFTHIAKEATKLYDLPWFTNDDRDRLTNLLEVKMLHTSKSN